LFVEAWNVYASSHFVSGGIYPQYHHITVLIIKDKVKLSLCFLTEHHAMKTYWGVEV
jgi:hypothetical protein